MVCVELTKPKILYDKPIYIEFSCLDLPKLFMYEFHYDVFKKKFPNATLAFTDTDSFLYEVNTYDIYNDLQDIKEHFDFSNYPNDHFLYSPHNKSKVGFMKDECECKSISKFAGLRSKTYSLITFDGKQTAKASGVKKHVKDKYLRHVIYKATVLGLISEYNIVQNSFRSYKHKVKTISQCRTGVSAYDDKRWIADCGILTRAHGHFKNE